MADCVNVITSIINESTLEALKTQCFGSCDALSFMLDPVFLIGGTGVIALLLFLMSASAADETREESIVFNALNIFFYIVTIFNLCDYSRENIGKYDTWQTPHNLFVLSVVSLRYLMSYKKCCKRDPESALNNCQLFITFIILPLRLFDEPGGIFSLSSSFIAMRHASSALVHYLGLRLVRPFTDKFNRGRYYQIKALKRNHTKRIVPMIQMEKVFDRFGDLDEETCWLTATQLSDKITTNPEEPIAQQLMKRAHYIGGPKALNAITEETFKDAEEQLKEMFKSRSTRGSALKFVPVSIKDSFMQEGYDSTCGATVRAFMPCDYDSVLIQMLRKYGMVPFVRTNIPQLLLLPESENNMFGRTNNPFDITRTPGGSSGGEAALIGAGCSPAGLGSDIGGSIRLPAHFTGIVGFKPTPGRLPSHGCTNPKRERQLVIRATAGPMARSVRDCVEMMGALTDPASRDIDPTYLPFKNFDKVACSKKGQHGRLRIGVIVDNGYMTPCATVQRAVREAAAALEAQGHEVVTFEYPTDAQADFNTFCSLLSADGNWFSFLKTMDGEGLIPTYKKLSQYTGIPNWIRGPLGWILRMKGEYRKASLVTSMKSTGGMNVRDYWAQTFDMTESTSKFWTAFSEMQLDGIIMPPAALPATKHGMIGEMMLIISYCSIVNMLHWPGGVVPVTTVHEDEAHYDADKLNIPQAHRDSFTRMAAESMEGSAGLPVGVQVITPSWEDEKCLFIMKEIEDKIKFKVRPDLSGLDTSSMESKLYEEPGTPPYKWW